MNTQVCQYCADSGTILAGTPWERPCPCRNKRDDMTTELRFSNRQCACFWKGDYLHPQMIKPCPEHLYWMQKQVALEREECAKWADDYGDCGIRCAEIIADHIRGERKARSDR